MRRSSSKLLLTAEWPSLALQLWDLYSQHTQSVIHQIHMLVTRQEGRFHLPTVGSAMPSCAACCTDLSSSFIRGWLHVSFVQEVKRAIQSQTSFTVRERQDLADRLN